MRPFDPRLLNRAHATRGFLLSTIGLGFGQGLLIIAQAWLLADAITGVFLDGESVSAISGSLLGLLAVVLARSVLAYAMEVAAFGSAARVKSQLRMAAVTKALALGPVGLGHHDTGELAQLTGRGIDALDAYFARYLPQLILAVIVPLAVGLTILTQDVLAAVVLALTLPLIPVFMVLIGLSTRGRVERQWQSLSVLSGYFLDLIAGLPTLRVFGRAKAQAAQLADVGQRYRSETMRVLRVSFTSALVLELLATLSVAIIAVSIGLRLLDGSITLVTGLFVLILAPEAYLPVRQVGVHFHAAAEGMGAADRLLTLLDEETVDVGGEPAPEAIGAALVLTELGLGYGDTIVVRDLSARFEPGTITALVGPSGSGKTTILRMLLRFLPPEAGSVSVVGPFGEVPLSELDPDSWRSQVAWVPQHPVLLPGTIPENIRLGSPAATRTEVIRAMDRVGLSEAELPDGVDTVIGEGSTGVSAGQARRIALARALLRDVPIVLLDEPTASLDSRTEAIIVEELRALRSAGKLVVVVAHRPALVELADVVLEIPLLAPTARSDHGKRAGLLPGVPT